MNDFNQNSQLHDMFEGFEATYSQEELQADWQSMADKIGAADTGLQGDAGSSGAAGSSSGGFFASGTAKILGLVAGLASIGAVLFFAQPTENETTTNTPDTPQVEQLTATETTTDKPKEVLSFAGDIASEKENTSTQQNTSLPGAVNAAPNSRDNNLPFHTEGRTNSTIASSEIATSSSNETESTSSRPGDDDPVNEKAGKPMVTVEQIALCANSPISLKLENPKAGATYTWSLLKEGTSKNVDGGSLRSSVSKVISQAGKYDLVVIELNQDNEPTEITRKKVKVMVQPQAIEVQANQNPCDAFELAGVADNATSYAWEIDGKTYSRKELEFTFKEMGEHQVSFIAKNGACSDTLQETVDFYRSNKKGEPELANVITPNGDGKNDEYNIFEKNPELEYSNPVLTIFDQNRIVVFKSSTEAMIWNGKKMNVGDQCVAGTYFYSLTYDQPCSDAQKEQVFGSIYLNR